VPAERFDRILSDNYAMDGQAAADAADSLGFGEELRHLASGLPTAEICSTAQTTLRRSG
jgi:general secretion pathway protein E